MGRVYKQYTIQKNTNFIGYILNRIYKTKIDNQDAFIFVLRTENDIVDLLIFKDGTVTTIDGAPARHILNDATEIGIKDIKQE